jgi:hypothetical protein
MVREAATRRCCFWRNCYLHIPYHQSHAKRKREMCRFKAYDLSFEFDDKKVFFTIAFLNVRAYHCLVEISRKYMVDYGKQTKKKEKKIMP